MDPIVLLFTVMISQQTVATLGWWIGAELLRLAPRAARHWAVFATACLCASVAGAVETRIPGLAGLTNLCLVTGLLAVDRGLHAFFRRKAPDRAYLVVLAMVGLVTLADLAGHLPVVVRAISIALILSLVVLHSTVMAARAVRAEFGGVAAVALCAPMVVTLLIFGARAARLAFTDVPAAMVPMAAGSKANELTLLGLTAIVIAFNLALAYLVLARLVRRLQTLSQRDSLTGLYNRREIMNRLGELHVMRHRHGDSYAVLMVDLDHFKRINDSLGHAAGDQVLKHFAFVATATVREEDRVGRLGGEEFCVLLPRVDAAAAMLAAGRLRAAVEGAHLNWEGRDIHVTVSIGVALIGANDGSGEAVLRRADAAMYRAKDAGRNRVVCADATETAP